MAEPLPEAMARSAARQVYRLLRFSAPLLRPIYRQIGLERRARAVTELVRIGWNGAPVKAPLASELTIAAPNALREGVVCIGHPCAESGIGEALRATAKGFAAAGVPFALVGLGGYTTARLGDASMAAHIGTCLDRRVNLFCDGIVGVEVALASLPPEALAGRGAILRPFWELAKVPARYAPLLHRFQEIWAPSEFVRAAFAASTEVPVWRIPLPITFDPAPRAPRPILSLPEGATLFLFAFDPHSFVARKNPASVIAAFKCAFPQGCGRDVGLVIKASAAGPHAQALAKLKASIAGDPRIHVIERTMSRLEMTGLLQACDAYVSLHRAEGFGLVLAEAMALGLPVIGTAYSGSADFLNPDTGYPVPFTLVAVKPGEYPDHQGQVWAEPDIDAAAVSMRALVERPAEARRIAQNGQRFIATHYSPARVGALMRERLEALGALAPIPAAAGRRAG
jgi:glycosyltransferase involved in cell wall biosynthesis